MFLLPVRLSAIAHASDSRSHHWASSTCGLIVRQQSGPPTCTGRGLFHPAPSTSFFVLTFARRYGSDVDCANAFNGSVRLACSALPRINETRNGAAAFNCGDSFGCFRILTLASAPFAKTDENPVGYNSCIVRSARTFAPSVLGFAEPRKGAARQLPYPDASNLILFVRWRFRGFGVQWHAD